MLLSTRANGKFRPAFIRRLGWRSATALSTGRVVQELNFGAEECRYNYTTLPRPRMSCLYLGENTQRDLLF
jgi:hypothetical protein